MATLGYFSYCMKGFNDYVVRRMIIMNTTTPVDWNRHCRLVEVWYRPTWHVIGLQLVINITRNQKHRLVRITAIPVDRVICSVICICLVPNTTREDTSSQWCQLAAQRTIWIWVHNYKPSKYKYKYKASSNFRISIITIGGIAVRFWNHLYEVDNFSWHDVICD